MKRLSHFRTLLALLVLIWPECHLVVAGETISLATLNCYWFMGEKVSNAADKDH